MGLSMSGKTLNSDTKIISRKIPDILRHYIHILILGVSDFIIIIFIIFILFFFFFEKKTQKQRFVKKYINFCKFAAKFFMGIT